MRADKGKNKALRDMREFQGKRFSFWASTPYTGGSPRQHVNEARYFREGDRGSLRRLRGIRTDVRYLSGMLERSRVQSSMRGAQRA
eukprot:1884139-Pyramimonas_sp.AAC.1